VENLRKLSEEKALELLDGHCGHAPPSRRTRTRPLRVNEKVRQVECGYARAPKYVRGKSWLSAREQRPAAPLRDPITAAWKYGPLRARG
jgi:hypothetical protein